MKKWLLALSLTLLPQLALAQQQSALTWIDISPGALSTAVTNCIPGDKSRKTLTLHSPATNTLNILYCFRADATQGTACTPIYTITPNEKLFWPSGSVPYNAGDCAAASGTPTLDVGYEK